MTQTHPEFPRPAGLAAADEVGLRATRAARVAWLAQISDPRRRERAACGILREEQPRLRAIAHRCCRYRGLDWARDGDDLVGIVTEVAWELLESIGSGGLVPESWDGLLFSRAAAAIRAWAQSGAVTGVGGMSGAMRRRVLAHRTRVALAQSLGREPTWQEIQEHANAAQRASRSDPEKSGALLTEADRFAVEVVLTGLGAPAEGRELPGGGLDESDGIDPTEVPGLVREIIDLAASRSRKHEAVAREWLRATLVEGGVPVSEVLRRVGMATSAGWRYFSDVRGIARGVCRARGVGQSVAIPSP